MILGKHNFIGKLFSTFKGGKDEYGLVSNNLVLMGASIYGLKPDLFNAVANDDFMWFFNKFLSSGSDKDKIMTCSCIYYFLKRKQSLIEFFYPNQESVKKWL